MDEALRYIESGILEMYVLGYTDDAETAEVEQMAAIHPEVRSEISAINSALESYARANAVEPDPTLQAFTMATIDYTERLKKGEALSFPPAISPASKVDDYAQWLNREDLQLQQPFIDFQAHIISHTSVLTTAIVWIKDGAPPETHTRDIEKFLIVEGTCDITVGNDVSKMKAGDVIIIPLHVSHHVTVTSECPCKIVLQRAAA